MLLLAGEIGYRHALPACFLLCMHVRLQRVCTGFQAREGVCVWATVKRGGQVLGTYPVTLARNVERGFFFLFFFWSLFGALQALSSVVG